ncbi:substrate-binding domain-containing protein [Streptomyces sp. ISL-100]|nr:substrate-binding domain-containing protein [Streptomyces sp. ISL-100]
MAESRERGGAAHRRGRCGRRRRPLLVRAPGPPPQADRLPRADGHANRRRRAQRPRHRAARPVRRLPRHVQRHPRPAPYRERRRAGHLRHRLHRTRHPRPHRALHRPHRPRRSGHPAQPEHAHLMAHFTPAAGMRHHLNRVHLPKVPLNRGQHYKLLVLLGGGGVGSTVRVTGGIQDGDVVPNESTTPDDKPPLFRRPARAITFALAVCVIALATLTVVRDNPGPPPMGCATGELTVTGSTAFTPVAEELAEKYQEECPGSKVTVDTHGSTAGIRSLDEAGSAAEDGSPPLIALSDGPKPNGYPQLRESRVAVSAFALVLNDQVPLKGLTTAQVRRLYAGGIRNWKELDGPDLPVRLISRDANSGTRQVFQRRVLGRGEPANSSQDCVDRDDGRDDARAGVIRCELDSTEQVLAKVASVPGALGYSELRSSGTAPEGLHRLRLDGREPSIEKIGTSGYPYHEIEYAYTYGSPPADSLVSSFLVYLTRGSGQDIIRTHGHLPCAAPEAAKPCAGG